MSFVAKRTKSSDSETEDASASEDFRGGGGPPQDEAPNGNESDPKVAVWGGGEARPQSEARESAF
jgi:hypothetical protein